MNNNNQEDIFSLWNQLTKDLVIDDNAEGETAHFSNEDQTEQVEELPTLVNQTRDEEETKLKLLYELQGKQDKYQREQEIADKLECTLSDLLQENKTYSGALKCYSDKIAEEEQVLRDLEKQTKSFEEKVAEKIRQATKKLSLLKGCEMSLCQDIEDQRKCLQDMETTLDTDSIDKENVLKKTLCNLEKSISGLEYEMEALDNNLNPAKEKLENLMEKDENLKHQMQKQVLKVKDNGLEKSSNRLEITEEEIKSVTSKIDCTKDQLKQFTESNCALKDCIDKLNSDIQGLQQQLEERYQALEESSLQIKTCKNCDKELPRMGPTDC